MAFRTRSFDACTAGFGESVREGRPQSARLRDALLSRRYLRKNQALAFNLHRMFNERMTLSVLTTSNDSDTDTNGHYCRLDITLLSLH